jgi:cell division protein WhiA
VAGSERDLVLALRAELAAIDPSRECDREAERAGLEPLGRPREPALARLALRLARRDDASAAGAAGAAGATFDWASRPDHCRMAWLRGRFLSRGSLSFANARTHLELVVAPEEAPVLAAQLAEAGMAPSWRIRRGRGVITWKSAETIHVVLRRIGAGPSLLELEARQIARSLRGELNRVLNAESANLTRTVAAAGRQLDAIAALAADGRLAEEPATVRAVAAARRETPEATLGELAERLAIHRSAVQRALERIERLARA